MVALSTFAVAEQLAPLRDVAALNGWSVEEIDVITFVLGLPGKDGTRYFLRVRCDDFPATPPAWHWINPASGEIDNQKDIPKGGNFFHNAGVICAPWNRLAYQNIDPRGPHSDWTLGNWQQNEKTGACRTLSAMAIRIAHELNVSLEGRLAA